MASINLNVKERVWTPNRKVRKAPYEAGAMVNYPWAISRTDNKTEVCEEAMVQFFKGMAKRG